MFSDIRSSLARGARGPIRGAILLMVGLAVALSIDDLAAWPVARQAPADDALRVDDQGDVIVSGDVEVRGSLNAKNISGMKDGVAALDAHLNGLATSLGRFPQLIGDVAAKKLKLRKVRFDRQLKVGTGLNFKGGAQLDVVSIWVSQDQTRYIPDPDHSIGLEYDPFERQYVLRSPPGKTTTKTLWIFILYNDPLDGPTG